MTKQFDGPVQINGTTLHARLDGPAHAPLVAMVNSLLTDHTMWDPQIPAFTQRYRVLRYDARGHGRSAAAPAPYTIDMLIDDLLGLITHFDGGKAHVVGLSLGSLTAIAAAILRPGRMATIVAADGRPDVPVQFRSDMDARAAQVRQDGISQSMAEATVKRWFTPSTWSAKPPYLRAIEQMILATSVNGFVGCTEAIKDAGVGGRVHEVKLPALIMAGRHDLTNGPDVMRPVHEQIAGSEFAVIEDAGHLCNIEQPTRFNATVLAFLDRHR
jgi:3-oxoadipate enol-lactonase